MRHSLTKVMREVAATIETEIEKVREEERLKALTDVSNILVWLNMTPTPTIEELRAWTLLEFAKASAKLDSGSSIRETIFHYRNQSHQQQKQQ